MSPLSLLQKFDLFKRNKKHLGIEEAADFLIDVADVTVENMSSDEQFFLREFALIQVEDIERQDKECIQSDEVEKLAPVIDRFNALSNLYHGNRNTSICKN